MCLQQACDGVAEVARHQQAAPARARCACGVQACGRGQRARQQLLHVSAEARLQLLQLLHARACARAHALGDYYCYCYFYCCCPLDLPICDNMQLLYTLHRSYRSCAYKVRLPQAAWQWHGKGNCSALGRLWSKPLPLLALLLFLCWRSCMPGLTPGLTRAARLVPLDVGFCAAVCGAAHHVHQLARSGMPTCSFCMRSPFRMRATSWHRRTQAASARGRNACTSRSSAPAAAWAPAWMCA